MFKELYKQLLYRNLSNIPGWNTKRKIIVIESDDWGSIRMPSTNVFNLMNKQGLDCSGTSLRYNQYDTLASRDDFSALFETLSYFKDINGNAPVFTALSVVANPDFNMIRDSGFSEYYYEPFTKTLDRYYGSSNSFPMWLEGIRKKLFVPQFHGREHLNVYVWMNALRENNEEARFAFDQGCWGFNNKHRFGISYQAAFDIEHINQLVQQKEIIKDGLNLFEKIFGYRAKYFVPPNGPFNNNLEDISRNEGISFMSSSKIQHEPLGDRKNKIVLHYFGQKNKYSQYYITRNCFFEPSENAKNWVDSCLKEIEIAFRWYKPAVISSHRVNYIGVHYQYNRDNSLQQLKSLLDNILNKWHDVEFMTSDALGELIAKSR